MILIETCEQYDAVLALLKLLSKLGLKKQEVAAEEIETDYSYDFSRKECCDSPAADCYCNHNDYPDYSMYDDDTSFEVDADFKK